MTASSGHGITGTSRRKTGRRDCESLFSSLCFLLCVLVVTCEETGDTDV